MLKDGPWEYVIMTHRFLRCINQFRHIYQLMCPYAYIASTEVWRLQYKQCRTTNHMSSLVPKDCASQPIFVGGDPPNKMMQRLSESKRSLMGQLDSYIHIPCHYTITLESTSTLAMTLTPTMTNGSLRAHPYIYIYIYIYANHVAWFCSWLHRASPLDTQRCLMPCLGHNEPDAHFARATL